MGGIKVGFKFKGIGDVCQMAKLEKLHCEERIPGNTTVRGG